MVFKETFFLDRGLPSREKAQRCFELYLPVGHLLTVASLNVVFLDDFYSFYMSTICQRYITIHKVLGRFEVSKDVYVKSLKKHAFDPLLSNRTTDYYHEIFTRHCLCFKAFQLR